MKRAWRLTFYFLGSVHFAVTLIGAAALFVIAGTVLESKTGSHRFAAYYTYRHPAFLALLSLFFVNILFAALRRWPYRPGHIPFLMTHLGLLMTLSGVMIKNIFGLQGNMHIMEGSGSQEIFNEEAPVIKLWQKNPPSEAIYSLRTSAPFSFKELTLELLGYSPHVKENIETWIKGSMAIISGLKPFKVFPWNAALPLSGKLRIFPPPYPPWNFYAFRVEEVEDALKQIYLANAKLTIKQTRNDAIVYQGSLRNAINNGISSNHTTSEVKLNFGFSPIQGIREPELRVTSLGAALKVPLNGAGSLINENVLTPHLGMPPLEVDLKCTPTVAILEDLHGDVYLFAFDPYGRVFCTSYAADRVSPLVVYDDGYGGYAALAELPFHPQDGSRADKEKKILRLLEKGLENVESTDLLAPAHLFFQGCKKQNVSFSKQFASFLHAWNKNPSWIMADPSLFPKAVLNVIDALPWEQVEPKEKNGCCDCCRFFQEVDPLLQEGEEPREILTVKKWPLPLTEKSKNSTALLTSIMRQLFSIASKVPQQHVNLPSSFHMFLAYMRAHGMHWNTLTPPYESLFPKQSALVIETPLTLRHKKLPPLLKLEENRPQVILRVRNGEKQETVSLAYDRTGSGLRWPLLQGKYLARFQPGSTKIPFRVRLRQARQIRYPDSGQNYSYESDLLITDLRDESETESTVSMNRVYETWDGYRFYLANLTFGNETAVKKIQLVVNYDPAKYYLTYPGGALVAFGIALLFCLGQRKHGGER